MPAFEMTANLFSLNQKKASQIMAYFGRRVAEKAIRQFLRATLKKIPVRTGFVRGSFGDIKKKFFSGDTGGDSAGLDESIGEAHLNLIKSIFGGPATPDKPERGSGKKFGGTKARLAASRKKQEQERKQKAQVEARKAAKRKAQGLRSVEYYYYGVGKGASKVEKTTTSGTPFATKPDQVLLYPGPTSIKISIQSAISYYRINDFYSRIKGAPWGSMEAGEKAILNTFNIAIRNFPTFVELCGNVRVAMRGSSISQNTADKDFESVINKAVNLNGVG